jgi:hypothetical protein
MPEERKKKKNREQKLSYCCHIAYSGFLHVMMANLIRFFLYPSIIKGITNAPFIVFHPVCLDKRNAIKQ